jgi:hypothetical protein
MCLSLGSDSGDCAVDGVLVMLDGVDMHKQLSI